MVETDPSVTTMELFVEEWNQESVNPDTQSFSISNSNSSALEKGPSCWKMAKYGVVLMNGMLCGYEQMATCQFQEILTLGSISGSMTS